MQNGKDITGIVHSIESLSGVDGEGIRSVVFMQGCAVNCSFCHNADTFKIYTENDANINTSNKLINSSSKTNHLPNSDNFHITTYLTKELASKLLKFKPYFNKLGGVTFSGGECLLQAKFVASTAKILVENNVSVMIETSGAIINNDVVDLLSQVSCVILDIKFCTNALYMDNTNMSLADVFAFLNLLEQLRVKTQIRSVLIKGITATTEHLQFLATLKRKYACIADVVLLNYHNLGEEKFEKLGIEYKLKDIELLNAVEFEEFKTQLVELLKKN